MVTKKLIYLGLLCCICLIIFVQFNVHAAYNDKQIQIADKNKIWIIKFNQEMDIIKLTKDSITVKDGTGNLVNVQLTLGNNNNEIKVIPPEGGYTLGEEYTLNITKKVCSKKNSQIKEERIVNFKIEEPVTNFSAYSSDKAFLVYGEISSTDFKEGKLFTVNAHIKNITADKYYLSSDGNIIEIHFEKVGSDVAYAETGEDFPIFDANSIIDINKTFTPESSGNYILSIQSIFLAINKSTNKSKEYSIIFSNEQISIK